jgi:uncharacterized protein YjiK
MKTYLFFGVALLLFGNAHAQCLKPISSSWLKFSEPSDLCATAVPGEYILLAEKGRVLVVNEQLEMLREAPFYGYDLEGVCFDGTHVYVSEESFQKILVLDAKTLEVIRSVPLHHGGGRNEGFEAMAYIPQSKSFLLSTEKDPQYFLELDANLRVMQTFTIKGISEVSAITLIGKNVYVLSDEDHALYHVDVQGRKIIEQYELPVINPEGVCAKPNGEIMVVSDDMAKLFNFQIPIK